MGQSIQDLARGIYDSFVERGYTWKIGGEDVIPGPNDIAMTLDKMRETLYDEPNGAQISVGRLIMIKDAGHFDIYTYFGEYEDG